MVQCKLLDELSPCRGMCMLFQSMHTPSTRPLPLPRSASAPPRWQGEVKRLRDRNLRVPWAGLEQLLQVRGGCWAVLQGTPACNLHTECAGKGRAAVREAAALEGKPAPFHPTLHLPCQAGLCLGASGGRHARLPPAPRLQAGPSTLQGGCWRKAGVGRHRHPRRCVWRG